MRKNLKTLAMGIVFAVALMFAPSAKAEAADMAQVNLATDSITVQWQPETDALKYNIYVGTSSSDATLYTTVGADHTTFTIPGLTAGSQKYISVKYEKRYTYSGTIYEGYVDSGYFKTLPGKVTGLKQEKWWYFIEAFDTIWNEMEAADQYEYIIRNSSGKKLKQGTTSSNRASYEKASNKKIYTVQVRAIETINGQKCYGAWSDKAYCFTQPRIKTLKASGNKITVKWDTWIF